MDLWLSLFNLWRLLIGDEKEPQPPTKLATESDATFAQRVATHDASADVVSFRERQSITKGLLGMAVHSSDLIHFTGISNPALVWKALENKYQATISIRFTRLMGHVFDLPKASDSDSLAQSIKEITDIKAQFKAIESIEWKCNEYTLVQALLRALPDFYAPLSQLILHSADANAGKLTLEGVINQIRNSEQYYVSFGSDNPHAHHTAMAARTVKSSKSAERPKPKELDTSKGDKWELSWRSTCGSCKRTGHIWHNCRTRLAKSDSPNTSANIPPSSSQSTNPSTLVLGQPDIIPPFLRLSTHSASFSNSGTSSFSFHVDSAATAHMESDYSHFTRYSAYNPPITVKLANDDVVFAPGWGIIKLVMNNGMSWEPVELPFLHVPDLRCTLISVSALASEGIFFATNAKGGSMERADGTPVAQVDCTSGLYYLQAKYDENHTAFAVKSVSSTALPMTVWHARMRHAANSTLCKAEKVVKGLVLDDNRPVEHADHIDCVSCVMGKQKHFPFPSCARHRATHIAELIHSDVWGPIDTATTSGETYFVAFTDDFSHYTTIYLIKNKSDVYSRLQQYVTWIENQSGQRVKRFRSDNGGEYTSGIVTGFLQSKGIEHELTMPYTAEQNGVAERGHQTIVTRALSAHHQSGYARSFWGYAILNSAYIKNLLPSSATEDKTPFELFHGYPPDVSHLRPFGCLAYAHIPNDTRHKYDYVSRRCFLLGHAKDVGYLLWDSTARQVVRSRNVLFDENVFYGTPNSIISPLVELYNQHIQASKVLQTSEDLGPMPRTYDLDESSKIILDRATPVSTVSVGATPILASTTCDVSLPPAQLEPSNAIPVPAVNFPIDSETLPPSVPRRSTRQRVAAKPALPRSVAIPTKVVPTEQRWTYVPMDTSHADENPEVNMSSDIDIEHSAMRATVDGRKQPPKNLTQARTSTESANWESAMIEELASLREKGTGVLTPLPPGRKAVGSRWVYAYKYDEGGQITRHKARLVAQGFSQIEGLDYTETFAPVAKYDTARALLSMVAKHDLELDQMDVKTAFLNGDLDEDIYMKQPPGFEDAEYPDWVWKLLKAIYGLKQSGRQWNKTLDEFLRKEGFNFVRSEADYSLYVLCKDDKVIWLLVYVDDMLLASNCRKFLDGFKGEMSKRFEMKDLGEARHFLGMHIKRDRTKRLLTIDQTSFLEQILTEAKMSDCRPVGTPMVPGVSLSKATAPLTETEAQQFAHIPYARVIGKLNFAMRISRPDIAYAVSTLSKFLSNPGVEHYQQLHHLLRYIRGTAHLSLNFGLSDEGLIGYSDSDFASDKDDSRSIGGYVYYLFGSPISWRSQKQPIVATSSTEAEYIALSNATREQIHLSQLLHDFGLDPSLVTPTILYGDNNGSRALTKNPHFHDRAKHIRVRYHFIRDLINDGIIVIPYIPTHDMIADIFTKSLPRKVFRGHRYSLALRSSSNDSIVGQDADDA